MQRLPITALSSKLRKQAKKLGVTYEFLFMGPSGNQLRRIASLVDDRVLRPVVTRTFSFEEAPRALDSLAQGGIRGKAVISGGP